MSCTSSGPFYVGTAIQGIFTVLQAGVLFDPIAVYAYSQSPSGQKVALTVVRLSQGVYQAEFVPRAQGPWLLAFSDNPTPPSSSNVFDEQWFNVLPRRFFI